MLGAGGHHLELYSECRTAFQVIGRLFGGNRES
jgi:hypothetical protein